MSRLEEIEQRLKAARHRDPVLAVFGDIEFRNHAEADMAYLIAQVKTMRDALLSVAEDERNQADDVTCDAGNWDGGSSEEAK